MNQNYVFFPMPGQEWLAHRHSEFLRSASDFIQQGTGSDAISPEVVNCVSAVIHVYDFPLC